MKKSLSSIVMLSAAISSMAAVGITSPSGLLSLEVDVDSKGIPTYSLDYKGKQIISPSKLGLNADETKFTEGFTIVGTDTCTVDRTWQPVWGEYLSLIHI